MKAMQEQLHYKLKINQQIYFINIEDFSRKAVQAVGQTQLLWAYCMHVFKITGT